MSPLASDAPTAGPPIGARQSFARPRPLSAELRDLVWLQRRLLAGALQRGEQRDLGRLSMLLLLLIGMLPSISAISIALLVALKRWPAATMQPFLDAGFTFLWLAWVASPVAGQQIFEGLHLSRLGHLPVSERGRSWGTVLSGALGLVGIASLPILLAAAVGGAEDAPGTVALLVSALLFLLCLALTRAIAATIYELVADDRQLRNLIGLVAMGGFLSVYLSQMGLTQIGDDAVMPFSNTEGLAVKLAAVLPSGFFTRALRAVMEPSPLDWLLANALLLAFVAVAAAAHARLQRRLYLGEPLPARAYFAFFTAPLGHLRSLVGARSASPSIPIDRRRHPIAALLNANLKNARRSVVLSRIAFLPVFFAFMAFFLPRNQAVPAIGFGLVMGGMAAFMTAALLSNSFGLIDHVGVSRLFLSPVPRRDIVLAHDLSAWCLLGLLLMPPALAGSLGAADFRVLPAALCGALLIQLPLGGIALFNSVRFPVYMDPERGQADANQSAFAAVIVLMLGGAILAAPPAAFVAFDLFLDGGFPLPSQPNWPLRSLAIGLTYGLAVHMALVGVATRLLPGREAQIIEEMDRNG